MSPFAVARERALLLRQAVLGDRAKSAVRSDEVIDRSLRHHKLVVHAFHPSSPRLAKADAVLFARMKTIAIRNNADAGERAKLLGHEIGHVELHPEGMAAHRTNTSDARSAGTQYVQAYGARERVERQANVFARELLLPREVALGLHKSGQSVGTIATALHLPEELVALQLLDALLLPSVAMEHEEVTDRPLTPEQQLAAFDDNRYCNVVAGPGSGKTKTLIGRVRHLIAGGCPAHRILVLTFSNKASREIIDRLDAANVRDVQNVWCGTFHQFGLEFIRKYHDEFAVDADVQVLDKLAQIEVTANLLPSLDLEHYSAFDDAVGWLDDLFLRVINRCREELVDAQQYAAAVRALPGGGTAQQRDAVKIFAAYEAKLRELKTVDFTNLVELPARRLGTDPGTFQHLLSSFDHVLVDEYQDVNRATAILLTAFADCTRRLWVVGDPHQAIYRFRGASLRNLTEFTNDFPNAKRRGLRRNWRTGTTLVDFVNHTAASGRLSQTEKFTPTQGNPKQPSQPPHLAACNDAESVHATLAAEIRQSAADGRRLREHLVLSRRNDAVASAAAKLEAQGIPCLYFGGFFERAEVRDVLCLFQLLIERFPTALTRVAALPGIQMPAADVAFIQAAVRENSSLGRLKWLGSPPAGLTPQGQLALERLRRSLKGVTWSDSPWDAFCHFLMDCESGVLRHHVDGTVPGAIRGVALWMLAYFCRAHDGHGRRLTLGRLLHRVRQRQRLGDVGPLRELPPEADSIDAVRLMTIHTSKGLEAPFVHLLDARESQFVPRERSLDSRIPKGLLGTSEQQQADDAEVEANNLLYVSVSRAKEKLVLYLDKSEYLPYEVAAFATYQGSKATVQALKGQPAAPRPAAGATRGPTSLGDLLAYSNCPRRFYYRQVLELQGSGDASLGARALYAALGALRRLVKEGLSSQRDQAQVLHVEWEKAGLPAEDALPALWRLARRKVAWGLQVLGGGLRPGSARSLTFGRHELIVEFDSGVPEASFAGALFFTYDPYKGADQKLMLDVISALGSRRDPKQVKLLNVRKELDKNAKGFPNGSVTAALDAMAAGSYPARPEPGKCASCPYLFICQDA